MRATVTLARYRARKIMEQRYREAGRKLASVKPIQLCAKAEAWLAAQLIEACAQELPRLGPKFKNFDKRKRY